MSFPNYIFYSLTKHEKISHRSTYFLGKHFPCKTFPSHQTHPKSYNKMVTCRTEEEMTTFLQKVVRDFLTVWQKKQYEVFIVTTSWLFAESTPVLIKLPSFEILITKREASLLGHLISSRHFSTSIMESLWSCNTFPRASSQTCICDSMLFIVYS